MKSILVTGLLFCLAGSTIHAAGQDRGRNGAPQDAASSTGDPIEMKTDRFSNVTTVTLKPQLIYETPDHFITMEITTRLGEKASTALEREIVTAFVEFRSQSKAPVDFGDEEIHFLINGKQLNLGKKEFKIVPGAANSGQTRPEYRLLKFTIAGLNREALESLTRAKTLEMRIGSIEPKLSNEIIAILREYSVKVLAQHKIARERQ